VSFIGSIFIMILRYCAGKIVYGTKVERSASAALVVIYMIAKDSLIESFQILIHIFQVEVQPITW